jgi:hypothetical protein
MWCLSYIAVVFLVTFTMEIRLVKVLLHRDDIASGECRDAGDDILLVAISRYERSRSKRHGPLMMKAISCTWR